MNTPVHSLKTITSEDESPKSLLTLGNLVSLRPIRGCAVETVFQVGESWIVITNNNCPYEETLNITYLNSKLAILDEVSIEWLYSTGVFKNFSRPSDRQFQFSFFGEDKWLAEISETPKFHLPMFSDPLVVNRGWTFKKHLIVRHISK